MTSRNLVHLHATVLAGVSLALGLPGSPVHLSLWWRSLTAFVAINLLQSALTGWCPMEIVLRRFGVPPGR
jgi:hypothetical protein